MSRVASEVQSARSRSKPESPLVLAERPRNRPRPPARPARRGPGRARAEGGVRPRRRDGRGGGARGGPGRGWSGESGRVIGLDRDPEMLALAEGGDAGLPVTLVQAPYSDMRRRAGRPGDRPRRRDPARPGPVVGPARLGASRVQLRGRRPARHAVRPERRRLSAADLVNTLDAEELADIFYQYGEERHSRRIARRIVEARRVEPIPTTARLAELVRRSIPGKWGAIDPATRVFQALRIKVNDELDHLDAILRRAGRRAQARRPGRHHQLPLARRSPGQARLPRRPAPRPS